MHDDSIKILENVRLVPKLRRNVISFWLLDSIGYTYKSDKGLKSIEMVFSCYKREINPWMCILEGSVMSDVMNFTQDA